MSGNLTILIILTSYGKRGLLMFRPFFLLMEGFPFTIDHNASIRPIVTGIPIIAGMFCHKVRMNNVGVHHMDVRLYVKTILSQESLNQALWAAKSESFKSQNFVNLREEAVPQPVEPDSEHRG